MPPDLDPGDVTDGESIQRMDNIFEGLVEYEAGSVLISTLFSNFLGIISRWDRDCF